VTQLWAPRQATLLSCGIDPGGIPNAALTLDSRSVAQPFTCSRLVPPGLLISTLSLNALHMRRVFSRLDLVGHTEYKIVGRALVCSFVLILSLFLAATIHLSPASCHQAMEKVVKTGETDVDSTVDVEQQRGRITYATEVGRRETLRRSMSGRRGSMDSMSIRPARRSIDPSLVLPPTYRTL
jgi:hypothetical protein